MAETPERPHRVGIPAIDLIIAVSVVLISVASLWVALRADQVQERTLAASVWPYLETGTSNVTETGTHIILYNVQNQGVGPALIRWFTMSYRGREFGSAESLLKACCNYDGGKAITSTIHNRVIAAHELINYVSILPNRMTDSEYHRLDHATADISVHGCYCSVLGQCWMLEPHRQDPVEIGSCPPSPVKRDRF